MGCVCQIPKMPVDKVFLIDISEIEKTKNSKIYMLKRPGICEVLMRSYSIKLQKLKSMKGDSPIEISKKNSNNYSFSENINIEENKELDNLIFINDIKSLFSQVRNISCTIRSVDFSLEYLESALDQQNFSMKVISDINEARINYLEYANKIDQLAKKVKISKNTNRPILKFNCNERTCRLNLTKGVSTFEESSYYIKNLNRKLSELKKIEEDINITFDENVDENNDEEIDRKVENLMEKVRGKYEIIAVNVVFIDSFDDPEMSTMISIVDGNQMEDIRKNIFSKEVTHILVNNKKIGKDKRIIYYMFAKGIL